MGEFAELKGLDGRLYRGLSVRAAVDLAGAVGVGPFRELAAVAVRKKLDLGAQVSGMLETALTNTLARRREQVGYIPKTFNHQERLAAVLGLVGETGIGALEMADHVLYDFDALLSPDVGRSTDSVTLAPRVAILYAYGIQIEAFFEGGTVAFYGGGPNGSSNGKTPSVALLADDAKAYKVDGPAFDRLQVWYSDPARLGKHASIDEVRRRVERDEERLLRAVARVDHVVALDDLDPKNPRASLDQAAIKLRNAGVARI